MFKIAPLEKFIILLIIQNPMENREEIFYFLSLPFIKLDGNTRNTILIRIIDFTNKIENKKISYKSSKIKKFIKKIIRMNIIEEKGNKILHNQSFKTYILNYDNYIDYIKNDNLNLLFIKTLEHILKRLSWFRGNIEIEPNIFKKSDFGRIQEAIETFKRVENIK